jgi:cytochrome c-type biogenesis protein CcmH/NrfG
MIPRLSTRRRRLAHEELVRLLEDAPPDVRRWARNRLSETPEGAATRDRPRLRRIAVGVATLAVTVGVVLAVYNLGGGQAEPGPGQAGAAAQQGLSPGEEARAARLTAKLEANPRQVASLVALGDLYFEAGDFNAAGGWMERAIAIDPGNVKARLALGAAMFNLGDDADARRHWLRVIAIDPGNVEAHYDLGFLYLSKDPPEMAEAKRMWRKVIELAPPGSSVAKTVTTHLEGLEKAGSRAATPPVEG